MDDAEPSAQVHLKQCICYGKDLMWCNVCIPSEWIDQKLTSPLEPKSIGQFPPPITTKVYVHEVWK